MLYGGDDLNGSPTPSHPRDLLLGGTTVRDWYRRRWKRRELEGKTGSREESEAKAQTEKV